MKGKTSSKVRGWTALSTRMTMTARHGKAAGSDASEQSVSELDGGESNSSSSPLPLSFAGSRSSLLCSSNWLLAVIRVRNKGRTDFDSDNQQTIEPRDKELQEERDNLKSLSREDIGFSHESRIRRDLGR